ncbi:sulfoxide reductase heme-binding subunit YedZ [Marivivens niveibacter]|uniref:Protein-methionine-sulfoxide reductase heme-binding subunit MsrQ n=1 Tax=Marivivens niveibacter TaxID=1930667 RepID=A0A251X0I5_9RHOB|nr:protein-methionine-sulfoxide reductase heme-binding subunit MsrQ [Marivivens niveibacter]OUD09895.1 sulfoxide reductase heme-binding subunit YedZ [Marivivens niveibacter]
MIVDRINRATRRVPAWPIYIVAVAIAGFQFYQGLTGALGPEPINALEREYGELALKLLIAGLVITPLRTFTGVNLIKYRRAIGLSAFFFATAHLAVWAFLDVRAWSRVIEEIIKRPYVTIGMAAFVLLIPLAVTSNKASIRAMGANWRKLHKLTYPAVLLGGIHYVWLVKGWPAEPFIYLAVIIALLAVRFKPFRFQRARA